MHLSNLISFLRSAIPAALVILISLISSGQAEQKKPMADNYFVAAYIWPSCHHDKRFGELLWPVGTGEWEVIKKGNPRFEGHYQPRQPYWGYEIDIDPLVV